MGGSEALHHGDPRPRTVVQRVHQPTPAAARVKDIHTSHRDARPTDWVNRFRAVTVRLLENDAQLGESKPIDGSSAPSTAFGIRENCGRPVLLLVQRPLRRIACSTSALTSSVSSPPLLYDPAPVAGTVLRVAAGCSAKPSSPITMGAACARSFCRQDRRLLTSSRSCSAGRRAASRRSPTSSTATAT
jgi:hypothetical protein